MILFCHIEIHAAVEDFNLLIEDHLKSQKELAMAVAEASPDNLIIKESVFLKGSADQESQQMVEFEIELNPQSK